MRIIALEEHVITPAYAALTIRGARSRLELTERSKRVGHDVSAELADIGAARILAMDKAGIDVQVLSLTMPGAQAFDATNAAAIARDANDQIQEAIKAHPMRFEGFAALPTADPAAAVKELQRAVTHFGFKGALINGHTDGEFLDDTKYWGIFDAAQALGVPIYLHPRDPHPAVMTAYFDRYEDLAKSAWGFSMDTVSHFLRIVAAGVLDTFPDLILILGHLGEGLPFLLHRMDDHTRPAFERRGRKKTLREYVNENVVVTCSGNFFVPALLCTVMALGIDNVLFSVDWPFESNRRGVDFLESLPLSDEDREKIAHGNAERVLGLAAG